MSHKSALILWCVLPFTVVGQAVIAPNYPKSESDSFGRIYYAANIPHFLGSLHFPATRNFVYGSYKYDLNFPVFVSPVRWDEEWVLQNGEDFSWPPDQKEALGQQVYKEPLSLISMIRHDVNKMGVSATGGVIYTGGDDVFAYAHYGRTGKLIWRTSAIANNMMATRWSLANLSIFGRNTLPLISPQLR
jgi:hypothetical protein